MSKQFESENYGKCAYDRRYWNTTNDACRMCEYRDDCPLEPDDYSDCIEDELYE